MADLTSSRDPRPFDPTRPPARSIVEMIGSGVLDAELAALLWLLVEARVPLVVAAQARGTGKTTLLESLLGFVPASVDVREVAGSREDYGWLPQASELGWPGRARRADVPAPVRPDHTMLLVPELSDHLPTYAWGITARIAIRAASIGYGLAATIHADTLDDVFETLGQPPNHLTDDELSHLGTVLVLRRVDRERRRVVAAHYLRPVARDLHGHRQRLGPAVLATWEPRSDTFEHFDWGVLPELAFRVGRRAGDFEVEVKRRTGYLVDLIAAGVVAPRDVEAAIEGYRPAT